MVNDFPADAWFQAGRRGYTPARLSLHLLQSVKFYLKDTGEMTLSSGVSFDEDCWKTPENDLPGQEEMTGLIGIFKNKVESWLKDMDLEGEDKSFPWAGNTNFSVALFLFRHFLFHLGELSSLLNESKGGNVEDHYVNA